jgi:hypothetical protein
MIEPVRVARSRGQPRNEPLVQPIRATDQRVMSQLALTVDLELDRRCRGRPDRKVDAAILDRRSQVSMRLRRAVSHRFTSQHSDPVKVSFRRRSLRISSLVAVMDGRRDPHAFGSG